MSDAAEQKKTSFDEIVRSHAVMWLLGIALAAATAGFGAYPALIAIAGRTTIESERLTELKKEAQERTKLHKQLEVLQSDLNKVTSGVNRLSGLMEAGFWAYREINLKRQVGASFEIGDCPGDRAINFP